MMDDLDDFLDWVDRNVAAIMFSFGLLIGFFLGKVF